MTVVETSSDLSQWLGALPLEEARSSLTRCCGSRRWVAAMLANRPWDGDEELFSDAEREWASLQPSDWLEAFSHHPRIGERRSSASPEATRAWSEREQAGAAASSEAVRDRLHELNQEYEARFGHVFLICATGKSGREMLAELERRLGNSAEAELREAAAEQAKITRIRLENLRAEIGNADFRNAEENA